jgi:hypothetical protein
LLAVAGLAGLLVSAVVVFAEWLLVPLMSLLDTPVEPAPWLVPAFISSTVALAVGLAGLGILQRRDRRHPL